MPWRAAADPGRAVRAAVGEGAGRRGPHASLRLPDHHPSPFAGPFPAVRDGGGSQEKEVVPQVLRSQAAR